jgi:DNA-binding NarL/FixJ family response regulator
MFSASAASVSGTAGSREERDLRPTRLFLVDDEGLVTHAIRLGLEPDPDLEIVGHASSGSDVPARVAKARPDVVLLDAGMPGVDGLELLDQLRKRCPGTKVVMLSADEDAAVAAEALRRGARAILGKGIDPGDVAPVISHVAEGRLVAGDLADTLGAMAGTAGDEAARLTEREREILEHVAAGRSNKQIARLLSLSERTIKSYLTHVYRKLRVKGRAEAAEHRLAGKARACSLAFGDHRRRDGE